MPLAREAGIDYELVGDFGNDLNTTLARGCITKSRWTYAIDPSMESGKSVHICANVYTILGVLQSK